MDKLKYVVGLLIGFIIAFIIWGRTPDVKIISDKVVDRKHETSVSTSTIKSGSTVTGGTTATIKPNGDVNISGISLTIKTDTTKESTIVKVKDEVKTEDKKETTTRSAFIYLDIGQCILVNPQILDMNKTYEFNIENFYIGATLKINPYLLSIGYQHLHGLPDPIQLRVSIPIL